MLTLILIVAAIGLCISIYTYRVERKIKTDITYKPMCDLSDRISCTKPMLSQYANIFYFSNAFLSISYYIFIMLLAYLNAIKLLFVVALAASIFSVYLGYLLYFKIKSFCILCTSMYVINFLILILAMSTLYA
jgi:vitamin-K-epoxide reductase (warfarin-sensitive)